MNNAACFAFYHPQGATVSASDISGAMAGEAQRRYEAAVAGGAKAPQVQAVPLQLV